MISNVMPEIEWRPYTYAAKSAPELREIAERLIDRLDRYFSEEDHKRVGLEFEKAKDGSMLATVDCPVGSGRIRLEWGALEGQLAAFLVLERQVSETIAQCGWQRCLKITLVENGSGHAGWGEEHRLELVGMPDYLNRNTVFMLGMMMVYAVARGPYLPDAQ